METRVSSKGQVVLPSLVRKRLGIVAGDPLEVRVDRGQVVLRPRRRGRARVVLTTSARTGLPVLEAPPQAPRVTSDMVDRLLDETS